jgi:mannose-1-phosphate guanylyltransferase
MIGFPSIQARALFDRTSLPMADSDAEDRKTPSLHLPGLWSIVLAGGEGNRTRPCIQRWLGRHLPKQYCAFTGTRSLLQHTLDRARRLAPDERALVVIDRTHKQVAESQLIGRPSIRVIAQPCNRDTAPGIFLPLTYLRRIDPQATVVIYPSDHFICPENRFVGAVREAVAEAASLDRLVLLGVVPDELDLEYGYIRPGSIIAGSRSRVRSVRAFIEKPNISEAKAAVRAGALWNIFVLIGKAELLWRLGWKYLPEMMPLFERLGKNIGSDRETEALDSIYASMPVRNFSSNLLQRAPGCTAVMKLQDVLWSDWGNSERIIRSLGEIHRRPAFRF